jgi:hypothetical protein
MKVCLQEVFRYPAATSFYYSDGLTGLDLMGPSLPFGANGRSSPDDSQTL